MGGFGSGRRAERNVTTDYRRLDVRALERAGFLRPGHLGTWGWYRGDEIRASIQTEASDMNIRLRYTTGRSGEAQHHNYAVRLVRTACHYGGGRPWFLCPCCGQRAAILYGGAVFACRRCYGLAYPVQRETEGDRAIRRAEAIRSRLGWEAGIANQRGGKPKGMHWNTFLKLVSEYDQATRVGLDGIARSLGIVNSRLSKVTGRS